VQIGFEPAVSIGGAGDRGPGFSKLMLRFMGVTTWSVYVRSHLGHRLFIAISEPTYQANKRGPEVCILFNHVK
jgi:hypothetical protein